MTYYREMGAKLDYGDFTEMGGGKVNPNGLENWKGFPQFEFGTTN